MARRTQRERIDIGKAVYEKEYSPQAAAEKYGVSTIKIKLYVQEYKESCGIHQPGLNNEPLAEEEILRHPDLTEEFAQMSRADLIAEIISLRKALTMVQQKNDKKNQ